MDSDGNGTVSQDEFSTAFEKIGQQTKSALLSAQEDSSRPSIEEMFSQADSDGDGVLSQAEFEASAPKGPPPGGPPPGGAASSTGNSDATSIFDSMDTDSDGSISEDEFTTALESAMQGSSEDEDQMSSLLLNIMSTRYNASQQQAS
jgi:Ca2+-binding EF-hand superfamily protein